MKNLMKEMLLEFVERDFTAYEMNKVLCAITEVEDDYKMIALYRKHNDVEMVLRYESYLRDDMLELSDCLSSFSLSYKAKDLVDNKGVEI